MPNGLVGHLLPRPRGLVNYSSVLDVGAGVRPIDWYAAELHICVEPHAPYAQRLLENGYRVVQATAKDALKLVVPGTFEAIYMLDVIEHMERDEGLEVIQLMLAAQPKQIVIYTPNGFLEQNGPDPWGMGGESWQQHRSGWHPHDFEGWDISYFHRGFTALWTAPTAH